MKRLNLQVERPVLVWARAEAARLNTDLSGLVVKFLREDRDAVARKERQISNYRFYPGRYSKKRIPI